MSAVVQDLQDLADIEVRLQPLTPEWVSAIAAVEQTAYAHPWTAQHFHDSLAAGYPAQLLLAGDTLLGYFVAMQGVGEVHLLNLTVAPAHQRRGWARLLLQALALWSRGQGAEWLWLEVRTSNTRAISVYRQHGFRQVGLRRAYYPAGAHGQREDALVMSCKL